MNSQLLFLFVTGLVLCCTLVSLWQLDRSTKPSISALSSSSSSSGGGSRPSVRILCLIITHPGTYKLKAEPVHETWARRCDNHIFVGSHSNQKYNPAIPLMKLSLKESRENLWKKTWMSFTEAADKFGIDSYDFFMKADDDTYVLVENLRLLLSRFDPQKPLLIGRRFKVDQNGKPLVYMSGGSGYLLSRESVRRFVTQGVRAKKCNLADRGSEDINMGVCLSSLGVEQVDTRDEQKLETFHPMPVDAMTGLKGGIPSWLTRLAYYPLRVCKSCISRRSVTFHYVSNMYHMDILLHYLQRCGVANIP